MPATVCGNFLKTTSQNSSSKASELDTAQYLYLTTRGRTSGQPREIEIWFTHCDRTFYVIAEYATSNWVLNIRASGRVQVRVADRQLEAAARVLDQDDDGELIRTMQELSRKKYGWGDGLVVEIVPDDRRV
jgi:deazaflavin-dependent oxidoreductase (nitroreductase family)